MKTGSLPACCPFIILRRTRVTPLRADHVVHLGIYLSNCETNRQRGRHVWMAASVPLAAAHIAPKKEADVILGSLVVRVPDDCSLRWEGAGSAPTRHVS